MNWIFLSERSFMFRHRAKTIKNAMAVIGFFWAMIACTSKPIDIGITGVSAIDPIDVVLTVETKGAGLYVKPRFENISNSPLYVLEGLWGFGLREDRYTEPSEPGEYEFVITLNGHPIKYTGTTGYYSGPPASEEFSKVAPGEVIATRYNRLDKAYVFEAGQHEYAIQHIHFQMNRETGKISEHRSRVTRFKFVR